jgi:hypothetical protein
MSEASSTSPITPIEQAKLNLEHAKLRGDTLKWIALSIAAVASFWIIDYGKLKLENFSTRAQNERELLTSYLKATDSANPEIWKRKLNLLIQLTENDKLRVWAETELTHIKNFAALDALYRDTLITASQLVNQANVGLPTRIEARQRFEQLYWADLPFAGESPEVVKGMVEFRNALMLAETQNNDVYWQSLNSSLIKLAGTLRIATKALGQN